MHHINAFLDTTGGARKRDAAERGPGYTSFSGPGIEAYEELSFWAAGHEPHLLPAGIGQRLPRQSDVILQIHYHPTGKLEVDRTRIGVYFSREPVKQVLHWTTASNSEFQLPAGNSNVEVKASWYIPTDVEALAVSPHMHSLGRDMLIAVTYPNGRSEDLIKIPEWDPDWAERLPLPEADHARRRLRRQGDRPLRQLRPRGEPEPSRPAGSPGASALYDEMCACKEGFLAVVKKGQDLTKPQRDRRPR